MMLDSILTDLFLEIKEKKKKEKRALFYLCTLHELVAAQVPSDYTVHDHRCCGNLVNTVVS